MTEDKFMKTTLNSFFFYVFNYTSPDSCIIVENSETVEVSKDVLQALEKLNPHKSLGPDRIYPKVLKEIKGEISSYLVTLLNVSLISGVISADRKLADLTTISKKGDKKKASNYRPISLISVIGKLLETIKRDRLVKHLEEHSLIRGTQHGFRHNRSCLANLLEFQSNLFTLHNRTKSPDIIYLDLHKVFEKVPHDKLMTKVRSLGVKRNLDK